MIPIKATENKLINAKPENKKPVDLNITLFIII